MSHSNTRITLPLVNLPQEICAKIMSFAPPAECAVLKLTCRHFRDAWDASEWLTRNGTIDHIHSNLFTSMSRAKQLEVMRHILNERNMIALFEKLGTTYRRPHTIDDKFRRMMQDRDLFLHVENVFVRWYIGGVAKVGRDAWMTHCNAIVMHEFRGAAWTPSLAESYKTLMKYDIYQYPWIMWCSFPVRMRLMSYVTDNYSSDIRQHLAMNVSLSLFPVHTDLQTLEYMTNVWSSWPRHIMERYVSRVMYNLMTEEQSQCLMFSRVVSYATDQKMPLRALVDTSTNKNMSVAVLRYLSRNQLLPRRILALVTRPDTFAEAYYSGYPVSVHAMQVAHTIDKHLYVVMEKRFGAQLTDQDMQFVQSRFEYHRKVREQDVKYLVSP